MWRTRGSVVGVFDSRLRGCWFEPHRSLILVQSRKTHPNMTENCWLGHKESKHAICDKQTNLTVLHGSKLFANVRVKSGIFGQTAKFGQRPCLFHISNNGIKNKLTKQTVKILMRRLIRSRLISIYIVCKCVSEFTWCPNLPDFTLSVDDNSR